MTYLFQHKAQAEALYDALIDDAFYVAMQAAVPQPCQQREAMLRYLDYSMIEAAEFGTLFLPSLDGSQSAYGASVWSRPLTKAVQQNKSQQKAAFIEAHMGAAALDVYHKIVAFMSAQTEHIVSDSAWYLSIVGVLPEFQNQGLGPQLIQPVLAETDALGIDTFLETFTPRNIPFYQRLGYQVVGRFYEPTAQCEYAVMVRECTN